jgi:hypothetical protein
VRRWLPRYAASRLCIGFCSRVLRAIDRTHNAGVAGSSRAGVALDAGMLALTPRGFQFIRAAIAQLVRGFRDRARPGYLLW